MDIKDYRIGQSARNFWTLVKNDLIVRLMRKHIQKQNNKILNVGVGVGDDLEMINIFGSVFVVDVNADALKIIPDDKVVEKKVANAKNLPYPDELFDIILCLDVIEHIKDDLSAILEIKRVLAKKGVFIFSVPAFQFMFSYHDRILEHVRRYTKQDLNRLLSSFSNVELIYWNSFLFFPVFFMRKLKENFYQKRDRIMLSDRLNYFIYNLLKIENVLIEHDFPTCFGLSIAGICRK
ncbi:MAG: class I SAM-dependent methyltransferase [Promethearchaeota archaeon]